MKNTVRAGQERAAINWSSSKWTQDLPVELKVKTEEIKLGLQAATTSLYIWTKSLNKKTADTKQDLHTRLNTMIQGKKTHTHTYIYKYNIQMRTQVEATQHGVGKRLAEVEAWS
jgi:hypothetical protein